MAHLNANTILTEPGKTEPVVLYAGDEVPEWATHLVGEHLLAAEDEKPAPKTTRK